MPANSCQLFKRPLACAVGVVILANLLFLLSMVAATGDPGLFEQRARTAFELGELGTVDYLPFDSRRGWHQYNDCNALQMLSNDNPSRLEQALAPVVYARDEDWTGACTVLQALVVEGVHRETLLVSRYARYWHGYNLSAALGLRALELVDYRRVLTLAVWFAIGLLILASHRSGLRVWWVGLAISLAAAIVWAVPYFAPGLTHGAGDAFLLLALAGIAVWPRAARDLRLIMPYAAGFGAGVAFFDMLTGQLPVAAAWLSALTLAAGRDVPPRVGQVSAPLAALAALFAFGLGAVMTVTAKQILALAMADPEAGGQFLSHLGLYMGWPEPEAGWPGILVPFGRLVRKSSMLTYGSQLAGYGLVTVVVLAWLASALCGWRRRDSEQGRDMLIIACAALLPFVWTLLMPRHTAIHAAFMVRMLVVPASLAPLALLWPRVVGKIRRQSGRPMQLT